MAEVRFALPPYRNASTALAVSVVVTSVVWSLAHEGGLGLYLQPASVLRGEVWQLATWIWAAFPSTSGVLFSALIIWGTGGSLEYRWGRTRFLKFVVITVTLAAVLTLGLAMVVPPVGGMTFFGAHVMSSIVWVGYGCSILARRDEHLRPPHHRPKLRAVGGAGDVAERHLRGADHRYP